MNMKVAEPHEDQELKRTIYRRQVPNVGARRTVSESADSVTERLSACFHFVSLR